MKAGRFTEEQIIAILREQEGGAKTADVCRRHGICTEIISALPDHECIIHHNDGHIEFAFRETLIATVTTARSEVRVISERKSPLANPIGRGRTENLQPDYGLWRGDPANLLEQIDIRSSVSGGSVTAGWYALEGSDKSQRHEEPPDDTNRLVLFLYHGGQNELAWRGFAYAP